MVTSHNVDAPLDQLIARAREQGLQVRQKHTQTSVGHTAGAKGIPTGKSPHSVAVSPDDRRLYTTNFASGTVSVIDVEGMAIVETIDAVEGPYGVAANPSGHGLHVAGPGFKRLVYIDFDSGPTQINLHRAPYGVAVSPDGGRVYLTLALEDSVLVTDQFGMEEFAEIRGIDFPTGVAVAPDESLLYVTHYFAGKVSVVDLAQKAVTATISVGPNSYGAALSPYGERLYVAHFGSDSVSVIDTTKLTVTDTIPAASPRGVAVNHDATRLYVTNFFGDSVTVIEL
jgi:YVTN family beta-propeller protein